VFLRYLQLLVAPWRLSLFYTWFDAAMPFPAWRVALSTGTLILLAGGLSLLLIRRRDLAFYGLAFCGLMIPYLNIQYIGIWIANRYVYLASFCLIALAVTLGIDGARRAPRFLGPVLVLLFAAFCAGNAIRQRHYLAVWRDDETLWNYEMSLPGAVPEPYYNLASQDYNAGVHALDPGSREAWFRKADAVIARGHAAFGSTTDRMPRDMYKLLFVEALLTIARQDPPALQLAALQAVERLNPGFEALLWQLTTFHYQEALAKPEGADRQAEARQALAYYDRYRRATYHDAGLAARDRAIRREFVSDFPFLQPEVEQLP